MLFYKRLNSVVKFLQAVFFIPKNILEYLPRWSTTFSPQFSSLGEASLPCATPALLLTLYYVSNLYIFFSLPLQYELLHPYFLSTKQSTGRVTIYWINEYCSSSHSDSHFSFTAFRTKGTLLKLVVEDPSKLEATYLFLHTFAPISWILHALAHPSVGRDGVFLVHVVFHSLAQCHTLSRCSEIICWVNDWIN